MVLLEYADSIDKEIWKMNPEGTSQLISLFPQKNWLYQYMINLNECQI